MTKTKCEDDIGTLPPILTRSALINDRAVVVAVYCGHVFAFQEMLRQALRVEPSLSREFSFAPS